MATLLTLLLVSALSGVPATAVVCDVLFCSAAAPPASGCHDHGVPGDGASVAASDQACVHPVESDIFIAPSPRHLTQQAAAQDVTILRPIASPVPSIRAEWPARSRSARLPIFLALRI